MLLGAAVGVNMIATADNYSGDKPRVYINPGHGGHSSDDRNVPVPPFEQGDTSGFWESNASLKKGFALQEVLRKKGYETAISRVTNDEESDLGLYTISDLANNFGADAFYAMHSNATGAGEGYRINFPLGLYKGYTGQAYVKGSDTLAMRLEPFFEANQLTVWTEGSRISGDWTFYPNWGDKVGLGVLRRNNCVAMLQEGSFHDYIPETYRLINPLYCWVEGWNYSLGADSYFNRLDQYSLGILAGNVRDNRLPRNATYVMHGADQRQPVNGAVAHLYNASGQLLDTCQIDTLQDGIYLFKYLTPGDYKVTITHPSYFTQSQDVKITANGVTYANFDMKRVRNTPPEVISYTPVWAEGGAAVRCNTPVILQFNWDMDTASVRKAFSISPAVKGQITWEDTNYRMVFTPDDAYDTTTVYTVTLAKTAQHAGGTPMTADFTMKFETEGRNHIYPLAVFPAEGDEVHYASGLEMEFRTDSLMAGLNLTKKFRVIDANGTELSFSTRKVRVNKEGDDFGYIRLPLSKALTAGQTYRFVADQDVADTIGLKLPKQEIYTFKAVNMGADKAGTLIDGFEDATNVALDTTASVGLSSASAAKSSTKLFGSAALNLTYAFASLQAGNAAQFDLASQASVSVANGDELGLHIEGDMSYNDLYLGFTDGAATQWAKAATVTWNGWRYVTFKVAGLTAGAHHLAGLRIVKGNTKMGRSGNLIVDNLLLTKQSGISDVKPDGTNGVHLVSKLGDGYLVASADGIIDGMQLYSMGGQLVAQNGANYINVEAIAPGAYVLKVYVAGTVTALKVVVTH